MNKDGKEGQLKGGEGVGSVLRGDKIFKVLITSLKKEEDKETRRTMDKDRTRAEGSDRGRGLKQEK